MNSMTGFGSREMPLPFGKVRFEVRSTNHKFLETVFHLPVGLLSLEDKIKKEVEQKIKRGRVVCVMNLSGALSSNVFINKELLKKYVSGLKNIQGGFRIKDEIRLDTLIHLPGVLSLVENKTSENKIWPHLKKLVQHVLNDLADMRKKEGNALRIYLERRARTLEANIGIIKIRFNKVIREKAAKFSTDDERVSFLKNSDITEELERLEFHIKNFRKSLSKAGSIGKELDFISQEMQREANTMGAKSCDVVVSARVVQLKSQIEKIREQLQNIE